MSFITSWSDSTSHLENNDVVHAHSNQDLIKTSKIEKHLRQCAKNDHNNSEKMAYECNVMPILVRHLNWSNKSVIYKELVV